MGLTVTKLEKFENDPNQGWAYDIELSDNCLRVFWRGFKPPQRPYFYNKWSVFGFGVGPFGFMFWPATTVRRQRREMAEYERVAKGVRKP